MSSSFIQPRKKTVLTQEFKLLISFFSMSIFMLVSTYIFLVYKNHSFVQTKAEMVQKRLNLDIEISNSKKKIKYLKDEVSLSNEIYKHNALLKESITNLFDLIPSRITLSEALLLENGLKLYGITPNKDIYDFMLQAPLRSIFSKTYTSFYPADNGWVRFVSTNYIDPSDEEIKKVVVDE